MNGTVTNANPNQLLGGSSSAPSVKDTTTMASKVENCPSGLIAMLLAIAAAATESGYRRRQARAAVAGTASEPCRSGDRTVSLISASARLPTTNTPANNASPSGGSRPVRRERRAVAGAVAARDSTCLR